MVECSRNLGLPNVNIPPIIFKDFVGEIICSGWPFKTTKFKQLGSRDCIFPRIVTQQNFLGQLSKEIKK